MYFWNSFNYCRQCRSGRVGNGNLLGCGMRDPRVKSHRGQLFLSRQLLQSWIFGQNFWLHSPGVRKLKWTFNRCFTHVKCWNLPKPDLVFFLDRIPFITVGVSPVRCALSSSELRKFAVSSRTRMGIVKFSCFDPYSHAQRIVFNTVLFLVDNTIYVVLLTICNDVSFKVNRQIGVREFTYAY